MLPQPPTATRVIGRYLLCDAIASGGMATVHLGRLIGPQGFSRTVAIKRLHPQFARDPEFVTMFLDEARLASRISHPNVVSPLDVISSPPELFIVMEYVHGESLSRLIDYAGERPVPVRIALAIMGQVLLGLHAAHVATSEFGEPLELVHRDVSPQNILVTEHGVARVVDFGIAKASERSHQTEEGKLKGKFGYMTPEQVQLLHVDQRSDIFAAGIVLWELLTGRRLFSASSAIASLHELLYAELEAPSRFAPDVPPAVDRVVMKALARPVDERFQTAREMAEALERAASSSSTLELSSWMNKQAQASLEARAEAVAEVEALRFQDFTQKLATPELFGTSQALSGSRPSPMSGPAPTSSERKVESSAWTPSAPSDAASATPGLTSPPSPASGGAASAPSAPPASGSDNPTPLAGLRWVLALGALGAAALVALTWLSAGREAPPSPTDSPSAASPPAAPAPGDERSLEGVLRAPPPAAFGRDRGDSGLMNTAPGAPLPPSSPATSAPALVPPPTPKTGSPAPRVKNKGQCEVPYTLDESGLKRFKPECL